MKTLGNAQAVIDAFVRGEDAQTPAADVPGGRRVTSERGELRSYRTVVAIRRVDEAGKVSFALTTKRYSVTTSKLMGHVLQAVNLAGFGHEVTGLFVFVDAAVPGRWGGFGPAWHPTGHQQVPFAIMDTRSAAQ